MPRALCWIRRDLRLHDHAPLAEATAFGETAVLFVFDRNILDALQDRDDRRITFIRESLAELDGKLRARSSALVVRVGDPVDVVPAVAAEFGAERVVTGFDVDPYALRRDGEVGRRLTEAGRELVTPLDVTVHLPGAVRTGDGRPFRVFTPYSRAWRRDLQPAKHLREYAATDSFTTSPPPSDGWSYEDLGFVKNELWLAPGEDAARAKLEEFIPKVAAYADDRNEPAKEGTSGLSVHLRFGTLSIRECVRAALSLGPAGEKWLTELIWRDFYHDVLAAFPDVVELPFQAQYGKIVYPGHDEHFEAWTRGETGYPIVDAAMRCLAATGWMHNRLRMVVASFLTKDLLVDYRKGEAWFARKLLDFELASNNGGWQWAASTGVDPQPYFRIFNPTSQSEKFDAEAAFIKRWIPELAKLPAKAVHAPWEAPIAILEHAGIRLGETYPKPIVDHSVMRERAISLLKTAR